jgi:hypothetical protein
MRGPVGEVEPPEAFNASVSSEVRFAKCEGERAAIGCDPRFGDPIEHDQVIGRERPRGSGPARQRDQRQEGGQECASASHNGSPDKGIDPVNYRKI